MKCSICGENHSINYHLKNNIERNGFPTDNKHYPSAHEYADKKEKEKYPSGYEKMKKVDNRLNNKELAGKNTKSGEIMVSKKVPKKLRKEVAYHEKVENIKLTKKK